VEGIIAFFWIIVLVISVALFWVGESYVAGIMAMMAINHYLLFEKGG